MDRRVHGVLDGEREPGDLSPAERARLREYREAMDAALEPLAREPAPDVTASVMARIDELEAAKAETAGTAPGFLRAARRAWEWVWRPREVRMRPAWALAAGMAVLVAVMVPGAGEDPRVVPGPVAEAGATEGTVMVQFRLDAPDARSVRLAGNFTEWEPAYELHEQAPGVWSVVVPLTPGVHDYAFVVDGRHWRPDPLAPSVSDGFGGTNSRLALMTPTTGGAL